MIAQTLASDRPVDIARQSHPIKHQNCNNETCSNAKTSHWLIVATADLHLRPHHDRITAGEARQSRCTSSRTRRVRAGRRPLAHPQT
jgi:hypothetical protein